MNKIGVIIGRFQVAKLHEGHLYLINQVNEENDEVMIMLGVNEAQPSIRNPLSFALRKEMILESFPQARVFEIRDNPSDRQWSVWVDQLIKKEAQGKNITLYGSRDSFKDYYSGEFPVKVIPEIPNASGTISRKEIASPLDQESFRRGVIHANTLRYPTSYQVVDVGVVKVTERQILLGRKDGEEKDSWRLPGGFVNPNDENLETAAARELAEEVPGLISHGFTYLSSCRINDYRYRNEQDKIMTALFLTHYLSGEAGAGDDLVDVRWFSFEEAQKRVIKDHQILVKIICEYLKKQQ